jgi:hypothetical protein
VASEKQIRHWAQTIVTGGVEPSDAADAIRRIDYLPVGRELDSLAQRAAYAGAYFEWLASNPEDTAGADRYATRRADAVRKALGYHFA